MRREHSSVTVAECVESPRAVQAVRDYFGSRGPGGQPTHPGSRFDVLGTDSSVLPNCITPIDLVAVGLMGHVIPPDVTIDLLQSDLGSTMSRQLEQVPADSHLGDVGAVDRTGCPAGLSIAWSLLAEHPGMHDNMISTLLARKRPALVPVMDDVVRCSLGSPPSCSGLLDELLAADHGRLRDRLADIHRAVGLHERISPIRVLHVVLWMGHHRHHLRTRCPGVRL